MEPHIIDAKVIGIEYCKEIKSFVLFMENENFRFLQPTTIESLLPNPPQFDLHGYLANKPKEEIREIFFPFYRRMIGTVRKVAFDPEVNEKLKEHYPLNY